MPDEPKPNEWAKIIKNIMPREPRSKLSPDAEPYLPDPQLIQAIDLAAYLRRPLLLEGEPGCGKTRFARWIAYEFGLPYFEWPVKSTSKALDGLYEYNALARLRDAHVGLEIAKKAENYIRFGVFGQAFNDKRAQVNSPPVVLIDEIDKADIDFPNDLLPVLDKDAKFEISETGKPIKPINKIPPIVIITSNQEKPLPDAFLRRCLYHYIEFPNPVQLKKIVEVHYDLKQAKSPTVARPSTDLTNAAINRLIEIREKLRPNKMKAPSTSEFLDWLDALVNFAKEDLTKNLDDLKNPLPYRQLLFKQEPSYRLYGKT
jgi:MoxR-like ATPase